jgi:hemerythrin
MTPSAPQCTPTLAPDLQLGDPAVDTIHAEFVQLLDLMDSATDEAFIAAMDNWIAHTEQHFAQEESWMEATDFGPRHCHTGHHRHVLDVAGLVRAKVADEGRFDLGRRLLGEVRDWFAHHVRTMDSMMVNHLREHGIAHAV